jgi:geranylgeranyl diphosphate synthase type II
MGNEARHALPVACAIEMIHTYSLIHDDLPALDDDDLRRGRSTCHVKFDEATAILTGDALLNMAFEVLANAGLFIRHASASSPGIHRKWLMVIAEIGKASGSLGMVEGQIRDLAFEGQKLDLDQLKQIHALKTGALIKASVVSGGLIGEASNAQLDQLGIYAERVGLAFQVMDDILNVIGDPDRLGKAVGTDQARNKNTFPSLMGLEKSKFYARTLMKDALHALSDFDNKADPLREIARYIVERKR